MLRLCAPLKGEDDIDSLKAWLMNIWINLATVDYPHASSFIVPLPAWPVKVCLPSFSAIIQIVKGLEIVNLSSVSQYFVAIHLVINECNVTECNNYRGIKLMCHGTKLYERLVEDRLRQVIEISSTQYGFQQGKSTTEPIVALRMMQEKH